MPDSSAPRSDARLAVLDAVRRGHRTVNALAAGLGVTDNAVRLHLTALERDGFLVRHGTRRSGRAGQPAAEYGLTESGELALSRAYAPALAALVAALGSRLDPRTVRAVLADAGRRLAGPGSGAASAPLAERAQACATVLETFGASVTMTATRREALITGAGCPLAAAVRAEPATCTLVEALLAKHGHVTVVQECRHDAEPSCRFRVTAP